MKRWISLVAVAGIVAWGVTDARTGGAAEAASAPADDGDISVIDGYDGDPSAESRLVADEDARLDTVRAVRSDSSQSFDDRFPFRVDTEPLSTLVLPPRATPYTLPELARLAPDTISVSADGVATIGESIYVTRGATLEVTSEAAHAVRLRSNADGYASIVAIGGSLTLAGTERQPLDITSWSGDGPDTETADGRAYVRVSGGRALVENVTAESLGFWSGNTGGLSFTGNADADARATPLVPPPSQDTAAGPVSAAATGPLQTVTEWRGLGAVLAAGPSGAPVQVRHVRVTDNAFGLFLSDTGAADLDTVEVSRSRVDGIVLHRAASGTRLARATVVGSVRDGMRVGGGSSDLTFDTVTARDNGRNGLTLHSEPLADGPSATGASLTDFAHQRVTSSTFADNADNGIRIYGGTDVTVIDSTVSGGRLGIVVSGPADAVTLERNRVQDASDQGIALWDGVAADVTSNTVSGADVGVYARSSTVGISGNSIARAHLHGISVVGTARGVVVADNVVSGVGPSAIDTMRAQGAQVRATNDVTGWSEGTLVSRAVEMARTPLALLWLTLGVVLLGAAGIRLRARRAGLRHPYPGRERLDELTPGVARQPDPPVVSNPRHAPPGGQGVGAPARRQAEHVAPRHHTTERRMP